MQSGFHELPLLRLDVAFGFGARLQNSIPLAKLRACCQWACLQARGTLESCVGMERVYSGPPPAVRHAAHRSKRVSGMPC